MGSVKQIDDTFLEKIDCNDLKEGMFVQELDRPWLETSFMFQGFCIKFPSTNIGHFSGGFK